MKGVAELWNELSLVSKIAGGLGAVLAGILKWRKDIYEIWIWAVARHDRPVLECFEQHLRAARFFDNPRPVIPMALSVPDISAHVKRKAKSVQNSLRRLERQGKVKEYKSGWMVPHKDDWVYAGRAATTAPSREPKSTKLPRIYIYVGAADTMGFPGTEFVLRNLGDDVAHNVQIEPLKLTSGEAVFRKVETIAPNEGESVLADIEQFGPLQQHDLSRLMMKEWNAAGKVVTEFSQPMRIVYEDYMENKFETTVDLVYLPGIEIINRNQPSLLPAKERHVFEIRNVQLRKLSS